MHLQLLGYIALQQAEIQAALAQVVAQGLEFTGVGGWEWFSANELDMAKWQRNPDSAGATAIR